MQNARLNESQADIKIAGRNINLRYADDITLMAESEEELKELLIKGKEENEKAGLWLNFQKIVRPDDGIRSCHFIANTLGKCGKSQISFGGLQNQCGQWLQPWN